jgi:alkylhydroperoxidase family enzyme
MTPAEHGELLAVIAMAAQTNRLAQALRVPVDAVFEQP